jgi:hypothetical protein
MTEAWIALAAWMCTVVTFTDGTAGTYTFELIVKDPIISMDAGGIFIGDHTSVYGFASGEWTSFACDLKGGTQEAE